MADGQAAELVEQAALLSRTQAIPWRVVYLETVASRYASPRIRQAVARALQEAELAGAEVLRLSLEIDSASRVVSTLVQQAQSVRATHVLLGNLAMGRRYWFNTGERISDFAETLMAYLPHARVHIVATPGRRDMPRPHLELEGEAGTAALGRRAIGQVLSVLALCTAVCALIAPHLHPINLSLIYMGGVFYVALRHGLKAALLTMLLAVLLFDWIFVEPRWSLKPTDPQYFFTFLITLCVGLAASRLGSQSRQAALQALVMAQHAQSLSLLSQSLAHAMTPEQITQAVTGSIGRDLGAQARLILLDTDGRLPVSDDDGATTQTAERVLRGEALAAGRQGFVLAAGGTPLGVLLVDGLPARHQGAGDLHLLQAYANQAAVAIARCRYAQRSEQAAIAAETERIRNTLLAGISHDFRTPLTAIIGAASAVLSQGRSITLEQRNALAQTVLDQATRLQSLTSDLLDMARLQDGRVRLTPEWCPVEDLVQDARAAVAGALNRHVLELDLDPNDVVWCDTTLMVQALANLLLNASQHSPAGSRIQLRIALSPGWWTLRVHDEGPGLAAGSEREVFQKFYRGPQGGSQGTGLGLAICDVVTRLHGGHIEARNDHGAVFELTLPQPERMPELEEALHG
ncbi:MAG: DUF4118 domain-containing protein [Hylemonella sp.]|uniref:DUF4118 domain-containing protein n=1 Tax=Hylemonella sp. TaxID=2066020 RepID=UPI0022C579A0|nr:DUF4118 domain-containing protein [Hylemonella sp.]MCZ8251890.1 DUF4118 domain-containing protein [Hylemonella sp.]